MFALKDYVDYRDKTPILIGEPCNQCLKVVSSKKL